MLFGGEGNLPLAQFYFLGSEFLLFGEELLLCQQKLMFLLIVPAVGLLMPGNGLKQRLVFEFVLMDDLVEFLLSLGEFLL